MEMGEENGPILFMSLPKAPPCQSFQKISCMSHDPKKRSPVDVSIHISLRGARAARLLSLVDPPGVDQFLCARVSTWQFVPAWHKNIRTLLTGAD